MHGNSFHVFRHFGLPFFQRGMDVLEVGPDSEGFCKGLIVPMGIRYYFADITNASPGEPGFVAMPSEYAIGCPDSSFDIVFSANVIEHVPKLWRWLAELVRVVRANGLIICVNPVSWPFHEAPLDCWRLFPEAYKALFEEVGLEHVFSWHGNLVPIDHFWRAEHGPQTVTDTIAVGRKSSDISRLAD